jgi:hypothetical protein
VLKVQLALKVNVDLLVQLALLDLLVLRVKKV